jgi:hypothetical protein
LIDTNRTKAQVYVAQARQAIYTEAPQPSEYMASCSRTKMILGAIGFVVVCKTRCTEKRLPLRMQWWRPTRLKELYLCSHVPASFLATQASIADTRFGSGNQTNAESTASAGGPSFSDIAGA